MALSVDVPKGQPSSTTVASVQREFRTEYMRSLARAMQSRVLASRTSPVAKSTQGSPPVLVTATSHLAMHCCTWAMPLGTWPDRVRPQSMPARDRKPAGRRLGQPG